MLEFNNIEFGNKLKSARIKKEFSLEYIAKKIGKNRTTVSRYEKGEILPDVETLSKLCNILNIYSGELYSKSKNNIVNRENSNNPFKVNKLYLYYKGYVGKKKLGKFKFIIDVIEQADYVSIKISDYKSKKTILIGHMLADDNIVSIRTENYKPNFPRLETNQIVLNVSEGTNGIILGTMFCTNGNYVPNVKKCIVSKKDMFFSDEMLDILSITEEEKLIFIKDDIWKVDIEPKQEYEYKEE